MKIPASVLTPLVAAEFTSVASGLTLEATALTVGLLPMAFPTAVAETVVVTAEAMVAPLTAP